MIALVVTLFRVEVVEPPRLIRWRWAREADTPIDIAHTTTVEWTLESLTNGGTRLCLIESGFEREKDFKDNSNGWQQELDELLDYIK